MGTFKRCAPQQENGMLGHIREASVVYLPLAWTLKGGLPHSCSVSLSVVPLHLLMWWRPPVRAPA